MKQRANTKNGRRQHSDFDKEPDASLAYIYCLTNANFRPVKVGSTTRSVAERARELAAATGVPGSFVAVGIWVVPRVRRLEVERAIHAHCAGARVDRGREFFALTGEQVHDAVIHVYAKLGLADFLAAHSEEAARQARKLEKQDAALAKAETLNKAEVQAERDRRLKFYASFDLFGPNDPIEESRQRQKQAENSAAREVMGSATAIGAFSGLGTATVLAAGLDANGWLCFIGGCVVAFCIRSTIVRKHVAKVPREVALLRRPEEYTPGPRIWHVVCAHYCGVMRLRNLREDTNVEGKCPVCRQQWRLDAPIGILTRPG